MFLAIGAISVLSADALVIPPTVQGIDYRKQIEQRQNRRAAGANRTDNIEFATPADMAVPAAEFTLDMIQSWAGEGSNRAALVIQWNDEREKNALVFGYRWDGVATGADMIKAVIEANPRLYGLIQYTNVSSPADPLGGYTINGFGWDVDDDGDIAIVDEGNNNARYESENGLFIHPRGYNPQTGDTPDYDYDNWKNVDTDDFWGAGWFLSYWSYYTKDSQDASFSYSNVGASGRVLQDGSWDAWNFSLNMMPYNLKDFEAAPPLIPEGAKTEFEHDGLYYKLKNYARGTVSLVSPLAIEGFTTSDYYGDITVPESFVDEGRTYTVVEIADEAFVDYEIGTVNLPQSVTAIGEGSFMGSTISAINGTRQLKKIGNHAFWYCTELHDFEFPAGITSIPEGLFAYAGLMALVIPDCVTEIGARAFAGDFMLESIVIPASVKSIDSEAFAECDAVSSVTSYSTYPQRIDKSVFDKSIYQAAVLTVPTGFEDAYRNAATWKNFVTISQMDIPVNVGDVFLAGGITYRVSALGESNEVVATHARTDGSDDNKIIAAANAATYTGSLTVPASVVYQGIELKVAALDERIFHGSTALESVEIIAPVDCLPPYSFNDCTALTTVKLPESITSIGTYAFAYSALTSMQLPETVSLLGERCFFQCNKLESVNLPQALETVSDYTFSYCTALKSISFGKSVNNFGSHVFQNCQALESVTLPASITEIPASTFSNCSVLKNVELPEAVEKIGNSAFSGCANLQFKLPASVSSIGSEAFRGMNMLTEFTLPAAMTTVPQGLFYDCTNLERVIIAGRVTSLGNNAFRNCRSLREIAVPEAETLADDNNNGNEADDRLIVLTIPDGVTSLGQYCFAGCTQPGEVVLPQSVTTLGNYVFDGATNLARINIPEGVTAMPGWGFRNTAIGDIEIPSTIKSMTYADVFANCSAARVFVNNTTPFTIGTYALRISGSKFVPVVVPYGCTESFMTTSNWKKSNVSSPEYVSSDIIIESAEYSAGRATLRGSLVNKFSPDEMPAAFALLNNATFMAECLPQLSIRTADSEGEYTVMPLEVAADGNWTLDFPWPDDSYKAEAYIALGNADDNRTPIAEVTFKAGGTLSVSDSLTDCGFRFYGNTVYVSGHHGEAFTVYNIFGQRVASFVADSDSFSTSLNIGAGSYILHGAGKTSKFIVL